MWKWLINRLSHSLVSSGTALLGLAGIALLWGGLLYNLSTERHAALDGAVNTAANLSRAFEEQIVRSIKAVDQSLMFVRESYARDPDRFNVADWARSAEAVTDVAIQLSLIDRDGFVIANSLVATPTRMNLSDREHIRVHMTSTEDKLFISSPVIGRVSKKWSIQFTRKLLHADGTFAGVAVISLDPNYLTRFYGSIDLGKHGAITLIGTDGIIRAAARAGIDPNTDVAIGKQVSAEELPVATLPQKARVGSVDLDQIRRITSFRQATPYPLIVAVGIGEEETLSRYWTARKTYTIVGGALTGLLILTTLLILLHQRGLSLTRERLRQSEADYAEKSHLLETALEHMGQGIMMIDGDRIVKVCNQRAIQKLGLSPDQVVQGVTLDDLLRWQWENEEFGPEGSGIDAEVRDFIVGGGISIERHTYERIRPNGQVLEIRSMPLADGGVVRTYTDVTERKAAEGALCAARDQANSAARVKSEFLATMSHEIRSPLSGLIGALDLLQDTPLDPDQENMTNLAHQSALGLLAILNDILDFSKIEANALSLSVEAVELRTLMSQVAQPHALVAARRNVVLRVHIFPDVPSIVRMDSMRVGQVVNNLLSNSVKFTEHGCIDLTVGCEQSDDGGKLVFTVTDTGCGMDAVTIARLFQPFTQADGSSSRHASGTGLGLSISRRLAEIMDGDLTVESALGQGSVFRFIMPHMASGESVVQASQAGTAAASSPAPGVRVLLVDDDPTNQWLSKRHLLNLQAVVTTVSSGDEALDALRTSDYDLMLTDCHMPGMDGVALTRAVRQGSERYSGMPIIGLTADVTAEQARRCAEAGMNQVVYKPLDRASFSRVLCRYAPAEPTPGQAFNPTIYNEIFSDDDPDGERWLAGFCDSARARMNVIRASVASLKRTDLESALHQLVGSSLSVGADQLACFARMYEQAALSAPAAELAQQLVALEGEVEAALAAIERFLRTQHASVCTVKLPA